MCRQHCENYLPWFNGTLPEPSVMVKRVHCQHKDSGQLVDKARITVAGRHSLTYLSPEMACSATPPSCRLHANALSARGEKDSCRDF